MVIRLKPDDPDARFPRCVYLSDRENELMVETDTKKELFLFDHIAHQMASQADIYRMIGQEVVQLGFQVHPPIPRASTPASSPTDKQEQERHTQSWEACLTSRPITTPTPEVCCLESSRMSLTGRQRTPRSAQLSVLTWRCTMSRYSTSYINCHIAFSIEENPSD